MRRVLGVLCILGLGAGVMMTLDSKPAHAADDTAAVARAQQIDALLEMSGPDRRAALKKLDPAERKGLWFELKKVQASRRSSSPSGKYSEASSQSLSGVPTKASRAVGTIAYDSGVPAVSFSGGSLVGNRFDTHTALPVMASGTVSTIEAVVVPGAAVTSSSAGFVLLGPQTGGGGAMAIFSTFTSATGTIDTLTFTGMGAAYT
ncbi:MAG: hypothetical protein K8J08_01920, partial [Thermoanaerobaculia bacterium]|nr:hypothetical protein [Thermoanaerobaculia bacterium]